MSSKYPTISVCMIVKNEEKDLPRLLSSIKTLADEVIIVDTGSEDGTVEIAQRFGAKVYHFEWCDDFAAARNESLRHATKDYILWLDADDEVPQGSIPLIKEHLRKCRNSAVFLKLRSIEGNRPGFEAMQLRMFPNHRGVQFEGRIHEQAIHSINRKSMASGFCAATIHHLGYEDQKDVAEKMKRNAAMLEVELKEHPDNFETLFFLARTLRALSKRKDALECLSRAVELGENDTSISDTSIYKTALVEKAGILCEYSRVEEAITLLEGCLKRFPGENMVRFTLGEIYFQKKAYEDAYATLLSLKEARFDTELLPLDVRAVRGNTCRYLGISSLYHGDHQTAVESLRRAIDAADRDILLYHYYAMALEKLHDIDGAIRVCSDALRTFDEEPTLIKRRFLLLVKKESFVQVIEEYKRLNGCALDIDVVTAMFLVHCKEMKLQGMMHYYALLQNSVNLLPKPFPEGFPEVKGSLERCGEPKALEFFDAAISYLLSQ